MLNAFRLRLGASLHFLIAIGHLICLFFLEEAFKAYGILDEMKQPNLLAFALYIRRKREVEIKNQASFRSFSSKTFDHSRQMRNFA